MQHTLDVCSAIRLSRAAAHHYAREAGEGQTFGAWVLGKFYPAVRSHELPCGEDFVQARRTEDARLYFSGLLQDGTLAAKPLRIAYPRAEMELPLPA